MSFGLRGVAELMHMETMHARGKAGDHGLHKRGACKVVLETLSFTRK